MNPDVVDAVAALERSGTLSSSQARLLSRVARGGLVSVHGELRLLAYAAVLVATTGVGLLVRENLDRIGPLAIVSVLAAGALVCFAWVARRAPAFTWGEAPAGHPALDYVLLLGALLTAAGLAYAETKFTPLGADWPTHLLLVAALYALLAVRYDSRVLLSLALSSFAAWRGVSTARLQHAFWLGADDLVRANAAACGLLFLLAGAVLRARARKAHFEPVAGHLGWLLLLGAAASGLTTAEGPLWALVLLGLAALAGYAGYRQRRFSLMAFGLVGAYAAVSALALRTTHGDALAFWWFALTPLGLVAVLFVAHHHLREPV